MTGCHRSGCTAEACQVPGTRLQAQAEEARTRKELRGGPEGSQNSPKPERPSKALKGTQPGQLCLLPHPHPQPAAVSWEGRTGRAGPIPTGHGGARCGWHSWEGRWAEGAGGSQGWNTATTPGLHLLVLREQGGRGTGMLAELSPWPCSEVTSAPKSRGSASVLVPA